MDIKIVFFLSEEGWEDKKTNACWGGTHFARQLCKETHFVLGCFEQEASQDE